MPGKKRLMAAAPTPDPFGERQTVGFHERLQLLGGEFEFETESRRLLEIVHAAYAGLPAHGFGDDAPRFRVRLRLAPAEKERGRGAPKGEPPPVRSLAGGGIVTGAMGRATFVAIAPELHSALIVVSRDVLRHAYHVRYELLEFAVYVLAGRVQGLVPLHAACIGQAGRGLLLVGSSGSGKSTLVSQALVSGLDFLSEDSVLVNPQGLRATGISNFVHLRTDSLRFLKPPDRRAWLSNSAVIQRRSGVKKLEIDLRGGRFHLAAAPLEIRGVVFLTARTAGRSRLLTPLSTPALLKRLDASQRYAANQPGWTTFREQVSQLPAYELRRAAHPLAGLEVVRGLLDGKPAPPARPERRMGAQTAEP